MRFPLLFAVAALLSTACASPLAMRSADILEPGELEVTAGTNVYVNRLIKFSPSVAMSARVGVADGMDLQLKMRSITLDLMDLEAQAGIRMVARDELDITLVTGVGYYGTLGAFTGGPLISTGAIDFPVGFLIDAKGEGERRLTVGLFAAPTAAWNMGDTPFVGVFPIDLRMGVQLGYTHQLGPLVIRPEIGLDTTAVALIAGIPWINPQAGLQIGARF
jgi:hypothetical protein